MWFQKEITKYFYFFLENLLTIQKVCTILCSRTAEGGENMIGERIGEYLNQNGITQAFLADKAKMTPISVSMVVNGTRKVSAEEYIRICRALKLDLEYFANEKPPASC